MYFQLFRNVRTSNARRNRLSFRRLSVESLETKRLLAYTGPDVISSDQTTSLTHAASSPGYRAVMVQPSGKVIAAGSFEGSQGDDFTLVRYTPNGQLDTTFDGDGVVQTNFSFGNPKRRNHDTLWGAGMDSQGNVVASGHDKLGNLVIARYSSEGILSWSVQPSVSLPQTMHSIDFDSTDAAFIAAAENSNSARRFRVIKYTEFGELDSSFGINGVFTLDLKDSMGISSFNPYVDIEVYDNGPNSGKILLVGTVGDNTVPTREVALIRINPDGTRDTTFDGDGIVTTNIPFGELNHNNYGSGVVIDNSNPAFLDRIVVVGTSTHGANVIRYLDNGALDATFNPTGAESDIPGVAIFHGPSDVPWPNEGVGVTRGRDVVIDDQGRIVVGARFDQTAIAGEPTTPADLDAFVVARLLEDGSLDTSFGDGTGVVETLVNNGWNHTTDITLSPNGDIWAAGHACSSSNGCDAYGNGEAFDSVLLRFSTPSPGITVSTTSLETSEDGSSAEFTIELDTQPTASVSVNVSSSDESEGTISGATNGVLTLNFDQTAWNVPQAVTVYGIDDMIEDSDQPYQVVLDPSSAGDANYDNLPSILVDVVNTDNESPDLIPLYIYDIRFESKRGGKDWRAVAVIHSDANGDGPGNDQPLAGVAVTIEFAGQSFTRTTNSSGEVRTDWIRDLAAGSYYANVAAAALAEYDWDPLVIDVEDDSDGDGKPDQLLVVS